MAPPLVYDNVARVTNSYENTLFNGVKFWIHQRVPTRSSIINSLTANGGKEVKLEKFADVIIADHARKDAPANSVSWKYITESVQRGELANIAEYRIGGPAGPARSTTGTSAPVKQTRTPFTPEEDAKLLEWVKTQPYSQGNTCFQEFAEQNPRHTWQSWKDRYRTKLQHLSGSTSEEAAAPPGSGPTPHPRPPPVQARTSKPVPGHRPKGRAPYTAEEDNILRDYVPKRIAEGEGERGNRIYQELAEMYPQRTFHSWRDRWLKYVSREDIEPANPPAVAKPSRVPEPSRVSQPTPAPQPPSAPQPSPAPPPSRKPQPQGQSIGGDTATPALSKMAQIALRAQLNLEKRAAAIIQRAWRAWHFRSQVRLMLNTMNQQVKIKVGSPDNVAVQPQQNRCQSNDERLGGEALLDESAINCPPKTHREASVKSDTGGDEGPPKVHVKNEINHAAGVGITEDNSSQNGTSPTFSRPRTVKEQFYIDIQGYYESKGVPPKNWLTVGNKTLDLWELWTAVTERDEEVVGYRNWEDIAATLNFDWLDNPGVTNELKAAFNEHLGEFELLRKSFDEMETEDEEAEGTPHEGPAQGLDIFNSSPPVPTSKRRREHVHSSPALGLSPARKRPRYSPDQEIPETPQKPEQTNGQTTLRTQQNFRTAEPMSLRTKKQHDIAQGAFNKIIPEPETQDFVFGQAAEPDLLTDASKDREPLLSDESDDDDPDLPTLEQLIKNPGKFKNPGKVSSSSSSDAFGTPMKSPPARPQLRAAHPNTTKPEPRPSAVPNSTPRPLVTNRLAPTIYFSPPRRTSSGSARRLNPTPARPPPAPLQRPREDRTRRPPDPPSSPQPLPYFTPSPPPQKPLTSLAHLTEEELEVHVREYVKAGYTRANVLTALQATQYVVAEAELVMESLTNGQGIPKNMSGVWTKKDDDDLVAVVRVDGLGELGAGWEAVKRTADENLERLVKKHGAKNVEDRRAHVASRL